VPQRGARASPSASSRIRRGAAGFPGVSVECGGDVVRAALGTARLLRVVSRVGEHGEGGRPFGLSSPREIGGSAEPSKAGSCLPGRCQRSSGRGGKAGTQTGRTPCLPPCLPDWVPMTFCDHEPAGTVRRGAHPLSAGPRSVTVDSAADLVLRAP
jgi:hypothetical protein